MEQITITRKEFRDKILHNERGFGFLRFLREHPEEANKNPSRLAIEMISQALEISEIESELFGKDED